MKIFLDEEYGYRCWIWTVDKTRSELIDWWQNLETVSPFFFNPSKTLPFGEFKLIDFIDEKNFPDYDCRIHMHEDEDSYLAFGEKVYYHKGYC